MSESRPRRPFATLIQELPARVGDVVSREQDCSEFLVMMLALLTGLRQGDLLKLRLQNLTSVPRLHPIPTTTGCWGMKTAAR